jgi:hypothetical protein
MRYRLSALFLALALLWHAPVWAAPSLQYTLPGTTLVFTDASQAPTGGAWTLANMASGTGQASALYDKNALATATGAMPALWEIRCRFALTGTLTIAQTIELYLVTSDNTNGDAGVSGAAALTSDQRRALPLLGILPVYQTTQNLAMTVSFRNVYVPERYFGLAAWNNTSIATQNTSGANRCTATPESYQMQ